MQDELSGIYKLATPYFPALGTVFVAVSAGTYRGNGLPMYFSEFFIFSRAHSERAMGRRSYTQRNLASANGSATGIAYLFELAKVRATAELANEVIVRLGSETSPQFLQAPSLVEATWDDVLVLFHAGLVSEKVLSDIASRTRAGAVVDSIHAIKFERQTLFEDAKQTD